MQREATDLPRSVAFDHGRLTSCPVSYGMLNTFCCVKLYCVYTMFPAVTAATFQTTVSKTG